MLNEDDKTLEQSEERLVELEDDIEIVGNNDINIKDDEKVLKNY